MRSFEGKPQNAGIYVHVPFCLKKCGYCNFYSVSNLTLMDAYVEALRREIALRAREMPPDFTADTLYFGGGTPSLLTPEHVRDIIETVRQNFELTGDSEITLEVNPATASLARLKAYRALGVNRLSIGMQSFSDAMLQTLGRAHKVADGLKVFAEARKAGFANISVDLIYGLPGQNAAGLAHDVNQVLALKPEHVSAYMLSLETGTPLAQTVAKGQAPPLEEAFQREAFDYTVQVLSAGGYNQYEISNFSRNDGDHRSHHNLKYWNFASYIGLGPGAHSFMYPNRRGWNISSVEEYQKNLTQNISPRKAFEILDVEQMQMELIYLGLRQNRGIDVAAFDALNAGVFADVCRTALAALTAENMVFVNAGFCALTAKGRPFLDYVTRMLVNEL